MTVNYIFCSRQRLSICWTGRSEALNNTDSLVAWCETGIQEGATKISCYFQVNEVFPIWLRPAPSTTQNTVASVER